MVHFFLLLNIHFNIHFFRFYTVSYGTSTWTKPKAYWISVKGKCSGTNPLAWKPRYNCWLAFASTGGTGWLSPIMGGLELPCCASRHYNWCWERNRFSKSLSAPCIIHTYAQKNTSVPLHTQSRKLSCSQAYMLGTVECVLVHAHLNTHTRINLS